MLTPASPLRRLRILPALVVTVAAAISPACGKDSNDDGDDDPDHTAASAATAAHWANKDLLFVRNDGGQKLAHSCLSFTEIPGACTYTSEPTSSLAATETATCDLTESVSGDSIIINCAGDGEFCENSKGDAIVERVDLAQATDPERDVYDWSVGVTHEIKLGSGLCAQLAEPPTAIAASVAKIFEGIPVEVSEPGTPQKIDVGTCYRVVFQAVGAEGTGRRVPKDINLTAVVKTAAGDVADFLFDTDDCSVSDTSIEIKEDTDTETRWIKATGAGTLTLEVTGETDLTLPELEITVKQPG